MVGLALLGNVLPTTAGIPTAASQAARAMGWEVYTTFDVPDMTL